jgi:regulator of sigma E protease
VNPQKPEVLHSLGIYHALEFSYLGKILPNGAAAHYGLKKGDKIRSIDSKDAFLWRDMVKIIASSPKKRVILQIQRKGELLSIPLVIDSRKVNDQWIGYLGIERALSPFFIQKEYSIDESFLQAIDKTFDMLHLTVQVFKKLFLGEISIKSLSGPVSIAKGAGESALMGVISFIVFVAGMSVNLGFINLLPIPMLDGGHLLFFTLEIIRRKPLSEQMQAFGLQLGMFLLVGLMFFALWNDFSRV